jgi:FtsH-binding integral membrane protein
MDSQPRTKEPLLTGTEKVYDESAFGDIDLESGLRQPIDAEIDRVHRNGFIRKVYGLLTAQLVLTTAIAAFCMLNEGIAKDE